MNDDRIAERAYSIWLAEGKPEGRAHRHWDLARAQLEAEEVDKKPEKKLVKEVKAEPIGIRFFFGWPYLSR